MGIEQQLRVGLNVHKFWPPLSLIKDPKYLCKKNPPALFGLAWCTLALAGFCLAGTRHMRMSTQSVYFNNSASSDERRCS